MCLTAKPTLEWAGSTVQVPAAIAEGVVVLMVNSFSCWWMRLRKQL